MDMGLFLNQLGPIQKRTQGEFLQFFFPSLGCTPKGAYGNTAFWEGFWEGSGEGSGEGVLRRVLRTGSRYLRPEKVFPFRLLPEIILWPIQASAGGAPSTVKHFRSKLGARLRGRTATQRSKKGSEKVLERVLGKGFSEGFWEGGLFLWVLQ